MKVLRGKVKGSLLRLELSITIEQNMPRNDQVIAVMFYGEKYCSQTFILRSMDYQAGFQDVRTEATSIKDKATDGDSYCSLIAIMSEAEFLNLLKNDNIQNEHLAKIIYNFKKNMPDSKKVVATVKERPKAVYNKKAIIHFFLGIVLAIIACVIAAVGPAFYLSGEKYLFIAFAIALLIFALLLVAKGANNLSATENN
ncbi:MAG: hypothetical protein UT48_C0003G0015 [Parcubacteria group bacterium GW2011_GWE2_39_37]|uniref:Uncharacterized protein n=1 Tax=Candidatus Falkowbacteria bacterium GW2011_GWF2_39_8 TaxID=1618642 RepID=A0A0G0PUI6_9BACT|nr:MAG: hypothetical protein UT48_C0003G0015 [Parcubacteria group bacterium GW2011_GWE2_39_37]KKR31578.1 MAG: hypothetical protein UT64_C0056G0003 [Candidatus Falkowbacteria bacterium GW2011_GWF2_39_8]